MCRANTISDMPIRWPQGYDMRYANRLHPVSNCKVAFLATISRTVSYRQSSSTSIFEVAVVRTPWVPTWWPLKSPNNGQYYEFKKKGHFVFKEQWFFGSNSSRTQTSIKSFRPSIDMGVLWLKDAIIVLLGDHALPSSQWILEGTGGQW